jgi:hypothetical protein
LGPAGDLRCPHLRTVLGEGKRPDLLIFQAFASASGLDDAQLAEILLQMYGQPHEVATTLTDTVRRVTGRPARTFAQWAAEHAGDFRP